MGPRTEAYEEGKSSSGGGNPWGGSSDSDRHNDFEDGKETAAQEEAEKDAND